MTQTIPVLNEIEVNITRLLGAVLTLMAKTPFFMKQPLPEVSNEEFVEAVSRVEGQNCALILNGSFPEAMMLVMQRNMGRITQLGVLRRVVSHLERSATLLSPEEQVLVVRFLGPAADAIFLLGMRILAYLLDPQQTETITAETFPWELLMVEGALKAAQEEIAATRTLSPSGRRYARATLWAFLVARDAMLTVGSH
jgi:hypothetical protein